MQLVRPDHSSQENLTDKDIHHYETIPEEVGPILKNSCYDCHSLNTEYPWYSKVAPLSWIVDYDVKVGRMALNFSEWGNYSEKEQDLKLNRICGKVGGGEMPHWRYLIMHKDAGLSKDEMAIICQWASLEAMK